MGYVTAQREEYQAHFAAWSATHGITEGTKPEILERLWRFRVVEFDGPTSIEMVSAKMASILIPPFIAAGAKLTKLTLWETGSSGHVQDF